MDHNPDGNFDKEWRWDFEKRRGERRKRTERLLRRICSELNIDEDVSHMELFPAREFTDLLPDTQICVITGWNLERPALPSHSYTYCLLTCSGNRWKCAELTPRNSALKDLLRTHWNLLPALAPVQLAHFILTMETVGTVYHEVLANLIDLDNQERRSGGYVLCDSAIQLVKEAPTSTSIEVSADSLLIRALTLHGWMHEKQNLGVTNITVSRDGNFLIGERQTLCQPVIQEIPRIWY